MSIETAADRAAFLADFGVLADWTVGATLTPDIVVLFDNGTVSQNLQETVDFLGRRATITLRADDLPVGAGAFADTIVINAVSYHPKAVQPDGQGMVVVTLEAV
jgi:hypothetical protein